ncbi:diacylglycerol/lipid kinase family protein [Streptomyces cyanogenus]|uniref:Diacylglycerol kinase n=1 Tax=Streptomyces cyanogenus TaxID=80860 RepID=A0ABX7TP44_STRCY|nr:diacylglycerol kinase family protein [Streptomyces cyanogenus]QTD96644.1 Diacylglycerol kinase [Streptomyces cyanogenus]
MASAGRVWAARAAVLALLGGVLVLFLAAGARSLLWVLLAMAGLALAAVGAWWILAHTGVVRACGAALMVAAPLTVLGLYAVGGMLGPAVVCLALWLIAGAAAGSALTSGSASRARPAQAPRNPWILMNPRSGGGKVGRFGLVDRARSMGARVTVLDGHQDVSALARRAVGEGADLLAVAGGDGTQALVAEVAHEHDLPFVVIPAGTRNHFALDLGLDRDDPAAALEALTDGVEVRVDLGFAADRVFVNNASFGTYAAVVGDPAYRDAKVRTALDDLPELLTGDRVQRLRMRCGRHQADGLQAVLVSNNPYGSAVGPGHGRRDRLDSGRLGVLCVRVDNAVQAARSVAGRGGGFRRLAGEEVIVDADDATVPVGIDGEHVVLPAPVVCRIVPGALRVRVPRRHVTRRSGPSGADWPRVLRLARGA